MLVSVCTHPHVCVREFVLYMCRVTPVGSRPGRSLIRITSIQKYEAHKALIDSYNQVTPAVPESFMYMKNKEKLGIHFVWE